MASLKYTVDVDTRGAKASLASLESSIGNLGAAVAGGFAVGEIVRFGDSIVGLQNKLRILTGDQKLVTSMFNDITKVAGAARAPLEATGDLYFKIARSAKNLGITQQETSDITETIAKSMSMFGASAADTQSALMQLGQAMDLGRFQGDELNAVLERLPAVADAMAKELGVTRGELKKLGSEGKVTSDVFVRAMQQSKKSIDDAFARSVPTAQQALNNLKTAFAVAMTEMAQEEGTPAAALADLVESILKLTDDIPALTQAIKDLVNVLTAAGIAFAAFKGYALVTTTIMPKLLGGITSVSGAFTALAGGARTSIVAMLGISTEAGKIRNSMVGLGSAFGIFDASRGKIMKTTANLGVLGTTVGRISQVFLSLGNIFGAVLRIGLRFAGWVGVFLAVVDVINLLYKAVTGSNEKLIDMGGILKGVWTVMRVLWGLLKVVGGYIGSFFAPVVQALANGWNSFMSAVMNTGPMKAAASMLSWVGEKLAWLWKMAKDISGVTAADQKATMDKIMSVPISDVLSQWDKDQKSLGKPGLKPKKNDVFGDKTTKISAPGGGGGGKSAKETAKEQAEALREVKKAIMEVTAAYREQASARLDDLNFQLKSLTMSEDQVQLEQNRKDILKEQADALKDLATKEAEIKNNKDLSNKGRQEALSLIAQERAAIQSATQEELAASEATLKAIQAKNIEIEKATKLMELQQKANENKAALQGLQDQLQLVGLYGDKLDEVTAQLELQQKIREIEVDYQNQLLDLENQRLKIGEARYAMELANIQAIKSQAIGAATEQAAAQRKLDVARKNAERNDWKGAIGKKFDDLEQSYSKAAVAAQTFDAVWNNMSNALDNFVETGKLKFGDLTRSILADIAKIALKQAVSGIFSVIGKALFRAAGGPVMAGKPYVVGEQGPELFVPNSAGSIMTNASMNKNAGGDMGAQPVVNNTYITNNISAIDSRSVAQMFVENRKALLGASVMARKEMPYGS